MYIRAEVCLHGHIRFNIYMRTCLKHILAE